MFKNFLFVISGSTGSGKTTICKRLLEMNYDLRFSISTTTRHIRENEKNGESYHFVSVEEYNLMNTRGEFLEYAKVFDNYYGTSIKNVVNILQNDKNVLFDIDWQGMYQLKERKNFHVVSIFLIPYSRDILKNRLLNRGEAKDNIDLRFTFIDKELDKAHEYDYVIPNYDLEQTIRIVNNIYEIEKIKLQKLNLLSNF